MHWWQRHDPDATLSASPTADRSATTFDTSSSDHTGFSNADLVATAFKHRTWGAWQFIAVWGGTIICVPTLLAPLFLFQRGFNWWQVILVVLCSQLVATAPHVLMGRVGAKYGVPFIVTARAVFGVRGSWLVGGTRWLAGAIGSAMFTWFGGECVFIILRSWNINFENVENTFSEGADIDVAHLISFLVFWLLSVCCGVLLSVRRTIWLAYAKTVTLSLFLIILVIVAAANDGRPGPLLQEDPMGMEGGGIAHNEVGPFFKAFFGSVARMSGFWLLYAVNISDYTRYAKSVAAQGIGHMVSIPLLTTFFAVLGMILTSQFYQRYGVSSVEDLGTIALSIENPALVTFIGLTFGFATLVSNLYLNVFPSAYCVANLAPSHITVRRGVALTALTALLFCPWKMTSNFGVFQPILLAFCMQFSVIIGIMLADFYIVNCEEYDIVETNYRVGQYWFTHGFHIPAFIAWALGVCMLIPGYVSLTGAVDATSSAGDVLASLLDYGWWIGAVAGGVFYIVAVLLFGRGSWTEEEGVEMITRVERKSTLP